MTDIKNCETCGFAALHAAATAKQWATVSPPSGRAKVLVVLGRAPDNARTILSTPAAEFMQRALLQIGWTQEQIEQDVAWTYSLRCPKPLKTKLAPQTRKLCMDYSKNDVAQLGAQVVVLCDFNDWGPWVKASTKEKTRGRALWVEDSKSYAWPNEFTVPGHHVLTVDDPDKVLTHPDVYPPETFLHDLKKIRRTLDGTFPIQPFAGKDYHLVTNADWAVQLLDWYAQQPLVGWDIETGGGPHGVDPFSNKSKIIGLSLSAQDKQAHFIPLAHQDCPLDQDPRVIPAVKRLLTNPDVFFVAHNGLAFDALMLWVKYGFRPNVTFDTMLADGELDENRSHTLKYLTELYIPDLGFYEDDLLDNFVKVPKKERDYELHVPLEKLGPYACADSDATRRLALHQIPQLQAVPHPIFGTGYGALMTHRMADAHAAVTCTYNGSAFNLPARDRFYKDMQERVIKAEAAILGHDAVKLYAQKRAVELAAQDKVYFDGRYVYTDWRGADLGLQPAFDIETCTDMHPGAREKLTKARFLDKSGNPFKTKQFGPADLKFNAGSSKHVGYLCKNVFGLSTPNETKKGAESWDADALKALATTEPFLSLILDYRAAAKDEGTYARPLTVGPYTYQTSAGETKSAIGVVRDDGYVHGQFLLCGKDHGGGGTDKDMEGGTKTKRKSSVAPNMQNFHKHSNTGKRLYRLFHSRYANPAFPVAVDETHEKKIWSTMDPEQQAQVQRFIRPGEPGSGAIVQWDYSQLELRVFAIVARIQWMLDRYAEDADLHGELAMESFQQDRAGVMANDGLLRTGAKSFWFGPIYGEGVKAMHRDMLKKRIPSIRYPGELITLEEVEEIYGRVLGRMPEFAVFKAALQQELDASGAVMSCAGTIRHLPHWFSTDSYHKSYAQRQAVNFTVQNPGAECLNGASYRVARAFEQSVASPRLLTDHHTRPASPLLVNQVHDSVIADVPSEALLSICENTRSTMEDPYIPILRDAPIPLKVDCELGPTWGQLTEFRA